MKRTRRLLLAGRPLVNIDAPDRWLIGLRWIAVAGMLATTLVAKRLVVGLSIWPLLGCIGLVAAINVFWHIASAMGILHARSFVGTQIAVDMVTLALILWLSGGVTNPFAGFLTFQIALSGLLRGGAVSLRMMFLAFALIAVLCFAPPLPWSTAVIDQEILQRAAHLACVVGLVGFMGLSAFVYGERLRGLEREGERNERLAMLGRVAGGIAHELNTPLATILVASNELSRSGRDLPENEFVELSQTLAHEARRACDVVELLRGRTRPDQHLEKVEVGRVVAEMALNELDRLDFRGDRIVRPVTPAGAATLAWVSRSALQQFLSNVLTNAVQATKATPSPLIEVAVSERGHEVDVTVTDNGPGIPAEFLRRLGEPFQTTKADDGGTGMGLYVCSVLAKRMGAQLHVESREGASTKVTLSLLRAGHLFTAEAV